MKKLLCMCLLCIQMNVLIGQEYVRASVPGEQLQRLKFMTNETLRSSLRAKYSSSAAKDALLRSGLVACLSVISGNDIWIDYLSHYAKKGIRLRGPNRKRRIRSSIGLKGVYICYSL